MENIASAERAHYPVTGKKSSQSTTEKYSVLVQIEPDGRQLRLDGREGWAARELIDAGEQGITAFDYPGVRVAHCVWLLRRNGILIETVSEQHGGQFPGNHARYKLATDLTILEVAALAA